MAAKTDIKDLSLDRLATELESLGEPAFRAKQIFAWLYRRGKATFGEFSDISRGLRDKLEERYFIGRLEAVERLRSADGVQKFLFRLGDGERVETVLIPSGTRRTVCLSTQAGCKYRCAFCASGLGGFQRDLTPSEITGQVLFVKDVMGEEPTNLVFMGMGEPLDNFDNVAGAIRIMNAAEGMGIAARRFTISTCGVVPGIERLAKLDLQVNLSLSLHAVTDRLRDRLMPVNRKYPLEEIVRACEAYLESGGRMMTLEYILIRRRQRHPERRRRPGGDRPQAPGQGQPHRLQPGPGPGVRPARRRRHEGIRPLARGTQGPGDRAPLQGRRHRRRLRPARRA